MSYADGTPLIKRHFRLAFIFLSAVANGGSPHFLTSFRLRHNFELFLLKHNRSM